MTSQAPEITWARTLGSLLLAGLVVAAGFGCKGVARAGDDLANSLQSKPLVPALEHGDADWWLTRMRVSEEEATQLARSETTPPIWTAALAQVDETLGEIDPNVRSLIVDSACDAWRGEALTEEFFTTRLRQHAVLLTQGELANLYGAALALQSDMQLAATSPDTEQRASVALLCFTASTAG